MPGFSFQSLFNEDPERQLVSGLGATSEWRIKPRSLMDEDADPRFPAFQQAWKQGADVGDLFGPEPFKLQGTVSPSGGDNTRADVAKVQTLLGKAGYLDLGQDGPSGYANPNTDKAIRDFQKDNGLQVDGVLKPGGPTIAKLGGLLGGRAEANSFMPRRAPFDEKPDVPDIRTPPTFPQQQPNGTRKPTDLLSILLGEAPEPTIWSPQSTPRDKPQGGKWTDIYDPRMYMSDDPRKGGITGTLPQAQNADPSTTATNAPFGSADGADHWAAGNMAQALLGRSDYADAVTHFRGEIGRNRAQAMPYLASVHQTMNEKNPELAAKFAGEMQKAGLADTPKPESGGNVLSLPIPATVTPGPVPPANPGETDIRIPAEQKPEPEKMPEGAAAPTPGSQPTSPRKPEDDIGRLFGMPVSGSEQTQPSPAPSGQKEPKPDEKPDPSTSPQWQPDKGMMGSGEHVTRTNGPVRIDRHSITPGLDGIVYNVEWFPLDKDGNVEPTIRKAGKGRDWGGHMLPGIKEDIHKPPYDHPNGWEVRVSIPPDQKYNKISGKPWLNILVPKKN